jgi:tetratricopeptide (TPR) repeat protein
VADLRERLQRIEALNVAGKYADALPLASQLADEAQATRFEPVQAEALFTYGDLRGKTGDFAGAEETLHRAALVADAAADDRTRAEAYGGLLVYAGREEAKRDLIPRLRDEGTAALTRLGVHDDTEALFFSDLGIALQSQGQFEDAREAYEHALALLEKLHGDENARVAGTLNGLAGSYTSLGDYDHAIALYERALATASRTLGPNHPRLSSMQSGLGWALSEQLEFAEAEGHFRAAVAIAEATLGPDHPRLAAYLDNLGESLSDQGKYADAVPIHERALAIRERFYKPDHPLLRDSLEGLGRALIGLGNAARAVPYLERALKLPGTGTATDNAEVEFTLAQAVAASGGSPKRAISLARAARDSYEASSRGPLEGRKLAAIRDWLARPPR